jgi:hypothetical protein
MIGTQLIESLVQSVALSHLIKDYPRVSTLLLASPESGKTTVATAANCKHVCRVAVISGRSILKELTDHPETEFLLFNDLSTIRAMAAPAVALLIGILNQLTQEGETGLVAFAGKSTEHIDRTIGVIGSIPYKTFSDHRAKWKEVGFISRMIPFAYKYPTELIATIKDSIDTGVHGTKLKPHRNLPKIKRSIRIRMNASLTRSVRNLADARSAEMNQHGIRMLRNYHSLIRSHALLHRRTDVTSEDLEFLRCVDRHVSITECRQLDFDGR